MEGKGLRTPFVTVMLGVIILSLLVLEQTQVEATVCCQGFWGRACHTTCIFNVATPKAFCAPSCGCVDVSGACPPGYDNSISPLKNSAGAVIEFCKLGCASTVCNVAISAHQNSREQVVKEMTERCNNACSEFCTKRGSTIALETA